MAPRWEEVNRGDLLNPLADDWNGLMRLGKRQSVDEFDGERNRVKRDLDHKIVSVLNSSGDDRKRFDAVVIESTVFTPNDEPSWRTYLNDPHYVGKLPASDWQGKTVIYQEDTPANKYGDAVVSGLTLARVNTIRDAGFPDRYARAYEGSPILEPATWGDVEIIDGPFRDDDEQDFAIVRVGNYPQLIQKAYVYGILKEGDNVGVEGRLAYWRSTPSIERVPNETITIYPNEGFRGVVWGFDYDDPPAWAQKAGGSTDYPPQVDVYYDVQSGRWYAIGCGRLKLDFKCDVEVTGGDPLTGETFEASVFLEDPDSSSTPVAIEDTGLTEDVVYRSCSYGAEANTYGQASWISYRKEWLVDWFDCEAC